MSKHGKNKKTIQQVSSKELAGPQEPTEVTDADVDFKTEEAALEKIAADLKVRKSKLAMQRKQATGGVKLARMRKHAQASTEWATTSAAKFKVSADRANKAVEKLATYEGKLGIKDDKQVSLPLIDELGLLTAAAEAIEVVED